MGILGDCMQCADCGKALPVFNPKTDSLYVIRDKNRNPEKRRVCWDCFWGSMNHRRIQTDPILPKVLVSERY